ncbi:hypothetical protein HY450_01890 [Candidatus Pacearchaeota archaeon]|nr:hypothetical protein [Candidatus Pacearchaeota archaeon]
MAYKYCCNQECTRGFTGVSRDEGGICPSCGGKIHGRTSLKIREGIENVRQIGRETANIGKRIGRKRMRQGLKGLIGGALITAGGFGIYNHFSGPEYLRGRELDRKAGYILDNIPSEGTLELELDNNTKVKVYTTERIPEGLYIQLDNRITFVSESWDYCFGNSYGDARNLDEINVLVNGKWEKIERERIEDYASWQAKYEELTERAYDKISAVRNKEFEDIKKSLDDTAQELFRQK